jgi:hypothetical protein
MRQCVRNDDMVIMPERTASWSRSTCIYFGSPDLVWSKIHESMFCTWRLSILGAHSFVLAYGRDIGEHGTELPTR